MAVRAKIPVTTASRSACRMERSSGSTRSGETTVRDTGFQRTTPSSVNPGWPLRFGRTVSVIPSSFPGTRTAECSSATLARTKWRRSTWACLAPTTDGGCARGRSPVATPWRARVRDRCIPYRPQTRATSSIRWRSTTTTRATRSPEVSSIGARLFPSCGASTSSPEFPRGRLLFIDADPLDADQPVEITELRLMLGGVERDLVDVAGFPNTYGPGNRVGLRLGTDSAGELYLLTKGDGWIRKLVPAQSR